MLGFVPGTTTVYQSQANALPIELTMLGCRDSGNDFGCVSNRIDTRTKPKVASQLNENK